VRLGEQSGKALIDEEVEGHQQGGAGGGTRQVAGSGRDGAMKPVEDPPLDIGPCYRIQPKLAPEVMIERTGRHPGSRRKVADADIVVAMRHLLDRCKVVVEPSGAITVAALMTGAVRPAGPTVAVLSGGNIEWEGLKKVISDQ